MNETKLVWEDLKLFLAVARAGGLAGAAHLTGKSPPTLGRRMLALEEVMGCELFNRLPRGYELTDHGSALLKKVVDLEAQILPLDRSDEVNRRVLVKVSAGSWITRVLCQQVDSILRGNDTARLQFISAEHVLDITYRETVIGIRNRRPEQSQLACRKLGQVQFAGYAVNKRVRSWVRVIGSTPSAIWVASQPASATLLEVTAPRNALDLACAGVARALLPTFIGDAHRELKRVTAPVAELTHDQWLVTHADERYRPEVRLTIDRITELLLSLHKHVR